MPQTTGNSDIFAQSMQYLGSAGSSFGGAGGYGTTATSAQRAAASKALGMSGGLSGAGFNPSIQQNQQLNLQTQGMRQSLKDRQRIMDLILGQFGGSGQFSASGGFGVDSILAELTNATQGRTAVINDNFANLANSTQGNFQRYGVGGSSGVSSVMSGIERQKALALGELDDGMAMNRAGVRERGMDRGIDMMQVFASMLG